MKYHYIFVFYQVTAFMWDYYVLLCWHVYLLPISCQLDYWVFLICISSILLLLYCFFSFLTLNSSSVFYYLKNKFLYFINWIALCLQINSGRFYTWPVIILLNCEKGTFLCLSHTLNIIYQVLWIFYFFAFSLILCA